MVQLNDAGPSRQSGALLEEQVVAMARRPLAHFVHQLGLILDQEVLHSYLVLRHLLFEKLQGVLHGAVLEEHLETSDGLEHVITCRLHHNLF